MAEKRKVWRVTDGDGNLEQVLVETSAEQVTVVDAGNYYNGDNVESVLQEVGADLKDHVDRLDQIEEDLEAGVGKVDDVIDVNGNSIVENKIAKLTAAAVGLGNVNATLDQKVDKTTTVNGQALSGNVTITNVETAGKATKDGSGNVIVDTYATKTDLQSGLAGKSSTKTYDTYSDFVDAVMAMNNTALKVGDNVLIKALDVPDMWVYKVNSTKTDYTYSSDANIVAALASPDGLTVGYYVFAKLETQKVDLTAYQTKTDNGLTTTANTITGAINEHEGDISALASRVGGVESKNTDQDAAIQTAQETATQAKNVAATNATAIENIVVNGTTPVKKAESATKLSASKTFELTGDVVGDKTSDLSSGVSIATTIADSAVTTAKITDGAVTTTKIADNAVTTAKLSTTGITAGTYTALTVDNKGRATAGGTSIEFGTSGQSEPSANLMVNGLFFQMQ